MPERVVVSRELSLARGGTMGNQASPVFTITAYNHSGGSLARGDVVIFDKTNSTADCIHCTTTTSANDTLVLGMVYDNAIASTKMGKIQVWGPTNALKVDGTTDIAVGDFIGTFTTVKIGAKTNGTGAFAIAMEAFTTNASTGVIDAFIRAMDIVSPDSGEFTGVTAGTVTASKAVVVGANKNLDTLAIADGGLCLGAGAGTAVSATAVEINANCDGTITQVTQSVAAANGNDISVTCTFKDAGGAAVAGCLVGYISSDNAGATPVATADTIAATTGAVVALVANSMFMAVSDAAGVVVIKVTEASTVNHYLNFILPTGKRTTSAVLAFD